MKKIILLLPIFFLAIVFSGCEKDNFEEPTSVLSGKIVYQDQTVGVRSDAIQLELWQYGYQLRTKIPVYVNQDGTYKAMLYDGEYKMVRLSGAPWENQPTDTITVKVKSNTIVDVPVVPYFIIKNASFKKEAGTIVAKFVIEKVSNTQSLELCRLYLGQTIITDQNNNVANVTLDALSIETGKETTLTVTIPASMSSSDYLFARVGVKAAGVNELYYTAPEKVQLK